jgi:MarR family transcriptional regulator, organic hydroperoxide resistance regulator
VNTPDPPESIDFLLANISHLHRTRADQLFESLGLYRGQPPVLRALWQQEGLTQTELAEKLKNTPATVTKMLQRMEKTGFIQRRPDANDQRVSRVYLTEAGRSVKNKLETIFQTLENETFNGLTTEQRALLREFFIQIRQNLACATGEEPWK